MMLLRIAGRAMAAGAILLAAVYAYLVVARAEPAEPPGPVSIAVEAVPVRGFREGETYGRLVYIGGLELRSASAYFGSLSGLAIRDSGRTLLAVGDFGYWIAARIATDAAGRPTGIEAVQIAPILARDIRPGHRKADADAESLAIRSTPGGLEALVGFEGRHRVLRFRFADFPFGSLTAEGTPLPGLPAEVDTLRPGKGLEALAIAPPDTRLSGAVVAIAERERRGEADALGWIVGGSRAGRFSVVLSDGYQITDAAFLPSGELLLLERRFNLLGIAARIRLIEAARIAPGARLDGTIIFEASGADLIDNMEGLAVETGDDGGPIVTLISDDNGSILQRTLLLRFRLTVD